jgi:hypothetical protein
MSNTLEAPHPSMLKNLSRQTSAHVISTHGFESRGGSVKGLSAINQTSAPLNWESSSVNKGEGHLAGLQKGNLRSYFDTGF